MREDETSVHFFMVLLKFSFMKEKIYAKWKGKALVRLSLLLNFLCLSASRAAAQDSPIVLENDSSYEIEMFHDYRYIYEATDDGELKLVAPAAVNLCSDDENFSNPQALRPGGYEDDGRSYSMVTVRAGETYYFSMSSGVGSGTLSVFFTKGVAPLTLVMATPLAGSALEVSMGEKVDFQFNRNVALADGGKCTLSAANESAEVTPRISNDYLSVPYRDTLYDWLKNGKVKAGDSITFTVTGLQNADDENDKYNGDGTFTIKYAAGKVPAELVEMSPKPGEGRKFLSYYLEGNEDGLFVLSFTKRVENGRVRLSYGNDVEALYTEELDNEKVKVTGDGKLVLDFSGKLRTPEVMLPDFTGEEYPTTIVLTVFDVKDIDGNYTYDPESGTIGSYTFEYDYEVVTSNVNHEWTPADGASLYGLKEIKLWIEDKDAFTFEGATFSWDDVEGKRSLATVPIDEITASDPGDGGVEWTIPLPQMNYIEGSEVTVILEDLKSSDGIDHLKEFKATFLTIQTAPPPFEFSSVHFLGISPDPETFVIEDTTQNEFTLTFDGRVILNAENAFVVRGEEGFFPFESITPGEGDTIWTVKVDLDSLLASAPDGVMPSLVMSFAPTDEEGKLIEGNTGEEETSVLLFEYQCAAGIPDFTVTPESGSVLESLDTVTVSLQTGITPSYSPEAGNIVLYDEKGDSVAWVSDCEPYVPEESYDDPGYSITKVYLVLSGTITEDGVYRLHIPAGWFNLSGHMSPGLSEGETAPLGNSKEMDVTYTIAQGTAVPGHIGDTLDEKGGVTVYAVDGRLVLKSDDAAGVKNLKKGLYIVNGKKVVVK